MDRFNNGEREILEHTGEGIEKVKEEVFTVNTQVVMPEETASKESSPVEASSVSQGKARVLTMEGAPKIIPIDSNPTSEIPIAASANLFDPNDRSNSGSSFVVVVFATIAFVVLAAVIGYGIVMMFK